MEQNNIKWELAGEIIDRVSVYDWSEIVEGVDKMGREWIALAEVSIGIIVNISDAKLKQVKTWK